MAVEPGILSLQQLYGAAQVSGTMDPPREDTKLLGDPRGYSRHSAMRGLTT